MDRQSSYLPLEERGQPDSRLLIEFIIRPTLLKPLVPLSAQLLAFFLEPLELVLGLRSGRLSLVDGLAEGELGSVELLDSRAVLLFRGVRWLADGLLLRGLEFSGEG